MNGGMSHPKGRASSNRSLAGRKMSHNMWRANMLFIHTHLCRSEMLSNQSCWWDGLGTQGLEVSGMKKMGPPL